MALPGTGSTVDRGEEMVEDGAWHEQESFWETVGPVLFTARRWEDARREVEEMVTLLGLSPGARVLDLCCGVSRHSV